MDINWFFWSNVYESDVHELWISCDESSLRRMRTISRTFDVPSHFSPTTHAVSPPRVRAVEMSSSVPPPTPK